MLDALRSGTTDPEILAELAKGRLRAKLPQLREGRFDELHALPIGAILAHLDFSMNRSTGSQTPSSSAWPLSDRRLSCCAPYPAWGGAPARPSSPRSAPT